MKKTSYFQIKSKIYHYYLAIVVLLVTAIMTAACINATIGIHNAANQPLSKMVYKSDNAKRKDDIPVYMEIARVSKYLFYQPQDRYHAESFYFEVTDRDNNKFIMRAAYDNGIEKAIEIKEALAKNAYNEEFFVYATGTTAMLSKNELKSIKEASNSPLTLDQLREKYGYLLFDLNQKSDIGLGEGIAITILSLIIGFLLYYLISSNLKFEASRKSIGYTKQALVQEWQNVDTKFRLCDVYLGEKVIFSTDGCVLYSDILYVYEGSQKYTEPVIINPGNLVTAELKNGKRVKIGKYMSLYKQYLPLLLPLIAQIKENVAKAQQQ
mgnify:FL=1